MVAFKNPYFNFAAAAILLVIIISSLVRKTNRGRSNTFFMISVVVIFLATCFDIFAVYYDNLGPGNVTIKYFAHGGYLFLHTATAFFYLFYIIALTDRYFKFIKNKIKGLLVFLPMLTYCAVFVAGFFNSYPVYYINSQDVYVRGPALWVGYVVAGIYVLFGIIYILYCRRLFTLNWILTLFAFYPFIGLAMVVEYFYPTVIIELFANAMAVLVVALYIQKPEELNEPITNIGNIVSFENHIRRNFLNEKEFVDIIICVKNYANLLNLLNYEGQQNLKESIGNYLRSVSREYKLNADLFNGVAGQYHVVVTEAFYSGVEEAAEALLRKFNSSELGEDIELNLQSSVCVLNVPGDINDFEMFRSFVGSNLDELSEENVSYASELFKKDKYRISLNIDKIIDEAIANGRLELHYQPIYSVKENRYIAVEALMRLNDPRFGRVSPSLFIPAAERNGAIHKLWDFSLRTVCRFVLSDDFRKSGLRFVDINLSAIQCTHNGLAEEIIAVIDSFGVPHDKINIEITETGFAYDEETLIDNINKLNAAGIGISLDDYGTGYSDTARVISLPLKIVKLDRNFVISAGDSKMRPVIEHTIHMLNEIKMEIIAEGIEDKELVDLYGAIGVDAIQGWYYSKALPKIKLFQFLEEHNA